MALQPLNWSPAFLSKSRWRVFYITFSVQTEHNPISLFFFLNNEHLNILKSGPNRKISSYLITIQLPTICGQSCLMYTSSTHFPHPDFFWRKSQTFCHFTHKYFRTCLSPMKIHTLFLLKISKPTSFLCSSSSKEGCTGRGSFSIHSSFLEGRFPFLFIFIVLHPGQDLSPGASLAVLVSLLVTGLTTLRTQHQGSP